MVVLVAMTGESAAADLYTYSNGDQICKGQNGYIVHQDGHERVWGSGYWLADVEGGLGLLNTPKTHKLVVSCS